MPMWGRSYYNPGVSGTDIGGVPSPYDPTEYLKALLQSEANFRSTPRGATAPVGPRRAAGGPPVVARGTTGGLGTSQLGSPGIAGQVVRTGMRDQILASQAREQGPPRRWTNVMGVQPFLTLDPDVMNAYQRPLYLPGSSGLQPSAGESAGAQRDLLADLAFQGRFDRGMAPPETGGPATADWWGLRGARR